MNPRSVWWIKCFVGCVLWLLGSQMLRAASLISVTPANQSVHFPVTSTVQFEFDHPFTQLDWMDWSAADLQENSQYQAITNTQIQWSADRRKLAVSVPEGFPAISRIRWNLGFGSEYGLPKSAWGSFSTGPATNVIPSGTVGVSVWRYSTETLVDHGSPFQEQDWSIQVAAPPERFLTDVRVLPLGGEAESFYGSGLFPTNFSWSSYSALGSVPVAGQVDLLLGGHGSNQVVRIPEFELSAQPRFLNVSPGDSIDPTKELIVEFAVDGLATTDVEFDVSDENGGTSAFSPPFGHPGALNGSSNRFVIAAGTLPAGDTRYFRLSARKSLTNCLDGVDVVLNRGWQTRLIAVTVGSDTGQDLVGEISTVAKYEQVGATNWVPVTPSSSVAHVAIASTEARPVRFMEITTPSGTVFRPRRDPYSLDRFLVESNYSDAASVEADFGPGNYDLTIVEPDQTNAIPLALDPGRFPAAPRLVNFAEAKSIQRTQDFVLHLDVGGDPADFVHVSVGQSFYTPDYGSPQALTGASNIVVIPKSAWSWWSTNELRIRRSRITKSEPPGLDLQVRRGAETVVQIRTAPVANTGPQTYSPDAAWITGMRSETNALILSLRLNRTNLVYSLLRSLDLIHWTQLEAVLATSTNHVLVDPSPTNPAAFYLIRTSFPSATEPGTGGVTHENGGGGRPPIPPTGIGP